MYALHNDLLQVDTAKRRAHLFFKMPIIPYKQITVNFIANTRISHLVLTRLPMAMLENLKRRVSQFIATGRILYPG